MYHSWFQHWWLLSSFGTLCSTYLGNGGFEIFSHVDPTQSCGLSSASLIPFSAFLFCFLLYWLPSFRSVIHNFLVNVDSCLTSYFPKVSFYIVYLFLKEIFALTLESSFSWAAQYFSFARWIWIFLCLILREGSLVYIQYQVLPCILLWG